ncbi:uncharacterized protein BO80DRAFT_464807 [Aspergillus ibericus CBS 121593]|uniref:Uncharacterized protein n=1 Tax=Aspergillus ibericus CBS 121593 TaxID=1448316 RepID=A0A395H1A7_9EURO|nr:hypothetical protein BO80DRAFT_464807 [Aspergillus ibericus CBS 121593]RAL01149.1 hypothetical protein BO80DRAFT_464807 [Aspergillus ibericus CBS 121593]
MSPVNSLWFKWKSLRLPWRRSFLVGSDLSGNTFWEFRDKLNAGRFRRIVKTDPKTHYSDVQVSPQWHQWLRYVRADPPSLEEQQQDVIRQIQIKELARLADERWASKPSYLDMPKSQQQQQQQPLPATNTSDATVNQARSSPKAPDAKQDPWAKAAAGNPGDNWQPDSWSPNSSKR